MPPRNPRLPQELMTRVMQKVPGKIAAKQREEKGGKHSLKAHTVQHFLPSVLHSLPDMLSISLPIIICLSLQIYFIPW